MDFDKIKPIFNIAEEDKNIIKEINERLQTININDSTKKKNLIMKSKVRSIYSSLAIEANSLSLKDVSNIIDEKLVLGKRDEVQEVKNANELYRIIQDFDWKKESDLIKAHMIMMKYFEDDNEGYRNHGEGVKKGDKIIFTAPESILVNSLMNSLFEFINDNKDKINMLVLASIFHYYFVYIHPFTDGNGRIARFWVSLMLINYNSNFEYIPIEEELYLNQDKYYETISECHNNGNANVFIHFMLESINNCLLKTTQKTTQIKLNKNQQEILKLIEENSSITRKEIATIIKLSEDGVKYNLKKLASNKIIERVGSDNGGYWKILDDKEED